MNTTIQDCHLIPFFHQEMPHGNLISAHSREEIPFEVKRVYYLRDLEGDTVRGNHANLHNQQVMVAVQGSFDVRIKDGSQEEIFRLTDPKEGLLVREGIWREVFHFSDDAICLVLCSEKYEEGDYVKEWRDYVKNKEGFNS
ncbi:WxcM-like domain-containing protein [Cyclobacteriaceae bacterium YHN15]|nr:WxcM-like domain-containing protein [Cyclobacteriaceae bacterium YHN15]